MRPTPSQIGFKKTYRTFDPFGQDIHSNHAPHSDMPQTIQIRQNFSKKKKYKQTKTENKSQMIRKSVKNPTHKSNPDTKPPKKSFIDVVSFQSKQQNLSLQIKANYSNACLVYDL